MGVELLYPPRPPGGAVSFGGSFVFPSLAPLPVIFFCQTEAGNSFKTLFMMAEDSESAASQQSLELDDQDTCGIDGDNEEENEHMQG